MPKIKLIGRTTDFKGKTLWEIVGNLKNFGVGRIITRGMFERYPEPCFNKILKVEALPKPIDENEERKVKVTVEKTFRGRTLAKPVVISSTSYKADYRLIPKSEEANYCHIKTIREEKILPRTCEFPPLLKDFIIGETGNPDPKLTICIKKTMNKNYRIAEEDETPTLEIPISLGKPASPTLYENIKL